MGYDLQITHEVEDVSAYAAERDRFLAMRQRCNLLIGHDMFRGATGYMALNIWSMRLFREVMEELGMVTRPPRPVPQTFPDEAALHAVIDADFGTPGIPVHKLMSNDDQLVCAREIAAALAAYDAYHDPEQVVGPVLEDIAAALAADDAQHNLRHVGPGPDPGLRLAVWRVWISFLRFAAVAGGFRVY